MYCAGCGAQLNADERTCGQCGRVVQTATPKVAEALEKNDFARTVRMFGRFYLGFAALNAVLGLMGLFMLQVGATAAAGPWEPWPHPPGLAWTYLGAAAWSLLILRVATAATAWYALKEHAECGRPMALLAGVVALTQFPIGLVLGAYTLARLAGRRPANLYHGLVRA